MINGCCVERINRLAVLGKQGDIGSVAIRGWLPIKWHVDPKTVFSTANVDGFTVTRVGIAGIMTCIAQRSHHLIVKRYCSAQVIGTQHYVTKHARLRT